MNNDGSMKGLGSLAPFDVGREFDFVLQDHRAKKAGRHFDLRMGDPQTGLLSWAVPKAKLPEKPGDALLAIRQPVHRWSYGDFTGRIESGRGAGSVDMADRGKLVVTEKRPGRIRFALLHQRYPSEYMLVHRGGDSWNLINVTPTESDAGRYGKGKYRKTDDPEAALKPGTTVSPKIDGAAVLLRLMARRTELSSIRPRKEGGPIRHTWKVGGGLQDARIPPDLRGAVLRGELYGMRDGSVITPAELGGLLNTDTLSSRKRQKERGTRLLVALYGMADPGRGEKPEGRRALREIFRRVEEATGGLAHPLEEADTPEEGRNLIRRIREGRHPLTSEGVVLFPPSGRPVKAVNEEDSDVYIRGIFRADTSSGPDRAGGFLYSLTPDGPVVGKVGSGFSREDAVDMLRNPEEWRGRTARISSRGQHVSGAYRSPHFIARHEG